MKTKTLIFFIDAVRPDYINAKHTPFLHRMGKQNTFVKLISLLGYSNGIHPTIWNGQYQEEHGYFLVYSYDPKKSTFGWMSKLRFIPAPLRRIAIAGLKTPFYWSNKKEKFPNWYRKKILPLPASIDPKQAKFFRTEPSIYKPLFFKELKQSGIPYGSQPDNDHPVYGKGVPIPKWNLTKNPVDYYFVYETDPLGHYYGPRSKEMKQKMKLIDKQIEKLYREASKEYEKIDLVMFSDHGMVEVKKTVNVKEAMDKSDLFPVKDYVVFYDSTMVRFWTKNKKIQRKIKKLLAKVPHITFLDKKLREKYHINFKTRKWGDLMFLADPGYRIFPDYFAPVRFNTKGMHGYWPELEQSKGVLITNTFRTERKNLHIVDLLPTLRSIVGLPEKKGIGINHHKR